MNTVSVIVPCYNRSEYLKECLESISKQTYKFIEVIVVDDASSEDLNRVVKGIEWPKTFQIQYVKLRENRGQGYAREVGRKLASGEYINYQDSDDLFHPKKIAKQVAALQNHPEAGMCYCITLTFTTLPFNGTEKLRGSHYIDKILPGLLEKRPWATGSCLWTRNATELIGPWFDGRREEDFLYEVRAGCKDIPVIYVPQVLMYVRNHEGEAEQRAPSKRVYQQAIAAYHEALNELDASGKLSDDRTLLAMTREIFRVCRKLFIFNDTETAFGVLKQLTSVGNPKSKTSKLYFYSAKLILLSKHCFPKKYQAHTLVRLCTYTMFF